MRLTLLKSKLHNLCVTAADLEYEGSIGLSADLLKATDIGEHEQVHIWNITRGTRLVTYAMLHPGQGEACVNGAAAHMAEPGDRVIVATFAGMTPAEAGEWQPRIVILGEGNRVLETRRGAPS
ncbi:MAG: aspartate 1-decarboxylase [Candidatus Poseidoniia archaeon]|jgi:aspartate 1-decarboxylase|nr:aspartate 1-decarboxylase [Candidatus Poseidoniia archaeon]MDP6658785.1 aspartate 1-decarboxylase [Candidatus Poseidoniia archaeon]MDP6846367.1 aspartate 1-decarboxylase [Candidatus Poseidoniia archaeon]MDP7007164.1 aspartate 1-decarboxylase [Candidatus Poseidoniia archaeon]|tara:strand:- start:2348 stop:2716 length:369 start_codon:yes stop_codon:yes gene_type:complete